MYKSDSWSIFPIEMVYGVIEVKTFLGKKELRDALQKCAAIRAMSKGANKRYLRLKPAETKRAASFEAIESSLPPRFFIFAYNGWKTSAAFERNCRTSWNNQRDSHLHGACILNTKNSLYVTQVAYSGGDFEVIKSQGFREFMSNLPLQLHSMLRHDRKGLGFDLVNMSHYELATERIQDAATEREEGEINLSIK